MWPFGMTRDSIERFLHEYNYEVIEILVTNFSLCVDEILTKYMEEDALKWAAENDEHLEVSGWD